MQQSLSYARWGIWVLTWPFPVRGDLEEVHPGSPPPAHCSSMEARIRAW